MALALDASVALKWVLAEPDSAAAEALVYGAESLLLPDFWLNEAINVLWLQVRRRRMTANAAREGLALLRAQVPPTPTGGMDLHGMAMDIGLATNHSPYDTLYVAFALAAGARALIAADAAFAQAMQAHPDPAIARLVMPLGTPIQA